MATLGANLGTLVTKLLSIGVCVMDVILTAIMHAFIYIFKNNYPFNAQFFLFYLKTIIHSMHSFLFWLCT